MNRADPAQLTPLARVLSRGFCDQGVDEAEYEREVFAVEFADGCKAGPRVSSPRRVGDEQVVGGDVEDFGEADHGVGGRGDAAGFVAADPGWVGAENTAPSRSGRPATGR